MPEPTLLETFLTAGQLEYPEPIPDPYSTFVLKIIQHSLLIERDGNMTQVVEVQFYTSDGAGGFGQSAADYFDADETLSEDQRRRLKRQYEPYTRSVSTRGYMIDPLTGEIVPPDEMGEYPEGSVEEKMAWLTVNAADVPTGDHLSEKVFGLVLQSIGTMKERKRL